MSRIKTPEYLPAWGDEEEATPRNWEELIPPPSFKLGIREEDLVFLSGECPFS